jgi:protein-tyrosine phosphatase
MSIVKIAITMALASCYLTYTGLMSKACKYSKYHSTLAFTLSRHLYDPISYPWWNQIEKNLYLGALPLKHMGHFEDLQRLGITDVITINEDFEISIQPDEWTEKGITNHRLVSEDYGPVSQENLSKGSDLINRLLREGACVYVHCKGGVGRSASLIIAKLIKWGTQSGQMFPTATDAINHASTHRPLINLNQKQQLALHEYKENLVQEH